MIEDCMIREIDLHFSVERNALTALLARHSLKLENNIDAAFGIFSYDDVLLGCGCAAGSLLKCFAVDDTLRGQNALGALVSRLMQNRFERGLNRLFVITRPHNRTLFSLCGFFPIAETDSVLILENQRDGLERYYTHFASAEEKMLPCGSIVMNCNPFTIGHRKLIEYAAGRCPLLHIFVVEEDRSFFPFIDRIRLVREGTADLSNVRVHPSGPYIISSFTFPTYFLKENECAADLQSALDISIFAQRIAPIFNITARFAGQEPLDPITRRYNAAMQSILPAHGIRFEEIPRVKLDQEIVSASSVRQLLSEEGLSARVLAMLPPCTQNYLRAGEIHRKDVSDK